MNDYIPKKVKIKEFCQESPDNVSIVIDFKVKHQPGQFVQLSLPGIGEAPISICSCSDKYMKLDIRAVGSVTNAISKLRENDYVYVRGPYGKGYPMEELKGNNIVLIGGGSGVAPLKGIIDYVADHRKQYLKMSLFLGYKTVNDVLFKREIPHWNKKYDLTISIDKAECSESIMGCDINMGFIADCVRKADISRRNTVIFLCGPPVMINKIIAYLKDKGFDSSQLYISAERLMQCALGICGHCMIHGKYTCLDGPVFRVDELEGFKND